MIGVIAVKILLNERLELSAAACPVRIGLNPAVGETKSKGVRESGDDGEV